MKKTLFIISLLFLSLGQTASAACPNPTMIEYDGACYSHESLHDTFDENLYFNEEGLSDYDLEQMDESWADEELELRHNN